MTTGWDPSLLSVFSPSGRFPLSLLADGVVVRELDCSWSSRKGNCLSLSPQGATEGPGTAGAVARPGGATATPVTGNPGGQRGPTPAAYTPGHWWRSELKIPRRGGAKPRAISPSTLPPAQGPTERHTYSWPCQRGLGGLPAWPSMGSFLWGERRKDGGPGNRTVRPSW